ncbi:MAG TPA: Ig-like domain-containing protein [Candidatus Eisenbacteria bacterium]
MTPRPALAVLVALVGLSALWGGCSKSTPPPVAPPPPPPPQVVGVSPAPRSTQVAYDADIWVEFADPLDSYSVTPQNVYLKLDTTRIPISVSWDAATRRIHVHPLVLLGLLTTYTVELSPNLLTNQGVPLGTSYFWQFTTTSVRRPSSPFPADRGVESPFSTLTWGGNETTPGTLAYEVYIGPDSAQVAARALPYIYRGARALYLPKVRWPEHSATFWSVTVDNATAGERSNGPVWRFDTPAADAPIDSVSVAASAFGYRRFFSTFVGACQPPELYSGGVYQTGIVWALVQQPQTLRLAGVRMDLSATTAYADSLPGDAGVWLTLGNMSCNSGFGPSAMTTDEVNGHLASGTLIGPRTLRFESDTLIAHIQANIRLHTFYGYIFRAKQLIHYVAPQGFDPAYVPVFKLYYYTGNGTMAPGSRAAPAAAGRAPAAPGRGSIFPLDRRRVESVNSR